MDRPNFIIQKPSSNIDVVQLNPIGPSAHLGRNFGSKDAQIWALWIQSDHLPIYI